MPSKQADISFAQAMRSIRQVFFDFNQFFSMLKKNEFLELSFSILFFLKFIYWSFE